MYMEYFMFSIHVTGIVARMYDNIWSLKRVTTQVLGVFVPQPPVGAR